VNRYWTGPSMNQGVGRWSAIHWTNESVNQLTNGSRWISETSNQWITMKISEPTNQSESMNQCESTNQSTNQSINQIKIKWNDMKSNQLKSNQVNQSNQSTNQSMNQWTNEARKHALPPPWAASHS
jgi:hypothetical protein